MNKSITAIIIDDEAGNIESLEHLLKKHCPTVIIIAKETDADKGLNRIEELNPELVFLDIHMPALSGFELVKKLEPVSFEVIFVTAYSEYAIEAFEYNAVGYITKPIFPEKLILAVTKAQEKIFNNNTTKQVFSLIETSIYKQENKKIPLSTMSGMVFVNLPDVIYCEGNGNCTNFHTTEGKKVVVSRRLGDYEKLFAEDNFVRIHDKYLINMKYINEYIKGRGGEIKLNNVVVLPVSVNRKEHFMARFDKWLKR